MQGGVRGVQPVDAGVFQPEPGELASGDAVGAVFYALDGFFQGEFAGEVGGEFLISHAGHGGEGRGVASVDEAAHFFQEAALHHFIDATVDSGVEAFSGHSEADDEGVYLGVFADVVGGGVFAAGEVDFQGAQDAAVVIGVGAFGGFRVDALEEFKEGPDAASIQLKFKVGADCRVGGDFGGPPSFQQSPDVLAGAADEEGEPAAALDVFHCVAGLLEEEGEAVGVVGVADVKEVMGDEGAFFGAELGGADVHASVYLAAVGVDDFAVQLLGELDGEGALADGGGAYDGYEGRRGLGGGGHTHLNPLPGRERRKKGEG